MREFYLQDRRFTQPTTGKGLGKTDSVRLCAPVPSGITGRHHRVEGIASRSKDLETGLRGEGMGAGDGRCRRSLSPGGQRDEEEDDEAKGKGGEPPPFIDETVSRSVVHAPTRGNQRM